ncbi:hypothetical protein CH063_08219 [Colletotrichum higginsianum]|uniref:Uncharacterized protein n=1 Tax=Colletotrichum higginsianum (strain IMI 349063) TaxID=759273 RepID=H1V913_COLHI|nr:uncharacterized protein CH63R_10881 [Colletotrichum higginsianum IMI 349063]OBR06761.1 hypothetical protein CH63R_10881 [Colletotrichum higginsianum IMI 349063]CCF36716.1 hypothetical protein CH063_08219 [Colletotrichum higginsianum]
MRSIPGSVKQALCWGASLSAVPEHNLFLIASDENRFTKTSGPVAIRLSAHPTAAFPPSPTVRNQYNYGRVAS